MMHHDWTEFEEYLQRKHDRNLTPMDYIRGLHDLISLNRKYIEHMARVLTGTPSDPAQEGE